MTPLPDAEIRRWVEKAEHDLKNAEHTLTLGDDCPVDTVCFHAQQRVEKYLKTLLVFYGIVPPRTHSLRVLMQMVGARTTLDVVFEDVLSLNRYPVESRYPGDWDPMGREEAEAAVVVARAVRSAAQALLPPNILTPEG